MKKLLLAVTLATLSCSSFAQIDDIINKPKENKSNAKNTGFTVNAFKTIFNRINSIDFNSLVDEMKVDGVTERKYGASIGVGGRILDIQPWADEVDDAAILPFIVRYSTDKKVYIVVSGVDFGNVFEKTLSSDERQSNGLIPVSSIKLAVFRYDDGMTFKDIKSVGYDLFSFDLKIPAIKGSSDNQYLAFTLGSDLGFRREDIILDNGQKMSLKAWDGEGQLGFNYNARGGVELKDEYGFGIVTVKGMMDYQILSATSSDYAYRYRTVLMAKPSVSLSKKLGKKTSLSLDVGLNLTLKNQVKCVGCNKDFVSPYGVDLIDLKSRNRRPVNASLKLKF